MDRKAVVVLLTCVVAITPSLSDMVQLETTQPGSYKWILLWYFTLLIILIGLVSHLTVFSFHFTYLYFLQNKAKKTSLISVMNCFFVLLKMFSSSLHRTARPQSEIMQRRQQQPNCVWASRVSIGPSASSSSALSTESTESSEAAAAAVPVEIEVGVEVEYEDSSSSSSPSSSQVYHRT